MMPSTKRYLTVLALGSVLSLTGTLAAEKKGQERENNHEFHVNQVTTFPGTIWMLNPCPTADHTPFSVDGTNIARYHANKNHASIHVRFLGKGLDSIGQPVKTFLHARGQVEPGSGIFDIPFESIWVDKGSHNFEFSANMHVEVVSGRIKSVVLFADNGYTLQCTDDTDANAADRRFNNDRDENDDKD